MPKIENKLPKTLRTVPLASLKPFQGKIKEIEPDNLAKLIESIKRLGFIMPVFLWEGNILDGHQRKIALEALEQEGWTLESGVPVIDIEAKDEKEAKEMLLTYVSQYADVVKDELADWIEKNGLSAVELDTFATLPLDLPSVEMDEDEGDGDDEHDMEAAPEPKAKTGDVYALGDHRLMCGDSTRPEDVQKLMGGKKAAMVFTDPPYALFGNSTGVEGITDDKMVRSFFRDILTQIRENTAPFGHVYVCCDWHSYATWYDVARGLDMPTKNCIVWDKGDGGIGAMYQNCHEFVIFLANDPKKKNTGHNASGARVVHGRSNIWRFKRVPKSEREHNAAKPVSLVAQGIENSSEAGDIVLDLFGGSGSTLIAAETVGRTCYLMEMEPKFVDMIIARWEKATGKKAVKL